MPESDRLPFVVINFLLFYLSIKVMTIIHECGHLITAYWVGGIPKRMILGTGHEVHRTKIRGIKVIVNSVPTGGLAIAVFGNVPHLRWRTVFYIVGGALSNLLTALLLYVLFGFDSSFFSGSNGISPASALILASAVGVLNLIPFYSSRYGSTLSSDGLLLIKILFKSFKSGLEQLNNIEYYFEAFEYYENRNYDEAFKIYELLLQSNPNDLTSQSMMALIYIKRLHFDDALFFFKKLENRIDTKELKAQKGLIYNNIAFTYLLRDEIEQASHYAKLAFDIARKNHSVLGTYGSVQVENGNIDTGISWLMNEVDMNHPNDHTVTASAYLMLAYHLKGDLKSRNKHLNFVRANEDKLDNDSRFLLERNHNKMGISLDSSI